MTKDESRSTLRLARQLFDECLAIRIRLIDRIISNLFDRELEKHGVTVAQVAIMGYLLSIQGGSPSEISKGLQIEKSTVSRNLARLKEKGWVFWSESRGVRSKKVKVTRAGMLIFKRMVPGWEVALKKTKKLLGPANVEAIHTISKSLGFKG